MSSVDRMLIFSDLHLRPESETVCFKVLKEVVDTAEEVDAHTIAFLGDWWHLRYQVPVYLLNRVTEWIVDTLGAGFELIFLPGNHDQIDEYGSNALQVFQEVGVKVYTEPTLDPWGVWMPYRKEGVPELLHDLANNALYQPPVLFAHLPVLGAMMNNSLPDTAGVPVSAFTGYSQVFLGHYHKRHHVTPSILYVGSPWQTRSDEWGQDKGFTLWYRDEKKAQFLPRQIGRRFHRFTATSVMGLKQQLLEYHGQIDPTQDLVSIELPTKGDLEAALNLIEVGGQKLGGPKLHVIGKTLDTDVPQPRFGFGKNTTLTEYAQAWAKEKGADVGSLAELMSIWTEITE